MAQIEPVKTLRAPKLIDRGPLRSLSVDVLLAGLPREIGLRTLEAIALGLSLRPEQAQLTELDAALGPGRAVNVRIAHERITELVSASGDRSVSPERLAESALAEVKRYLDHDVYAGEHLADQLLLPLALAGGGSFSTLPLTLHARTQIEVLATLSGVKVDWHPEGEHRGLVDVGPLTL